MRRARADAGRAHAWPTSATGPTTWPHSYLLGGATAGLHVRIGAPDGLPARAGGLRAGRRDRRRRPAAACWSPTRRARRSRAPTWWPPTPGSRWARRATAWTGLAIFAPYAVDRGPARPRRRRRDRAALPARLPRQGDRRRGDRRARSPWSGTRRRTAGTCRRRCWLPGRSAVASRSATRDHDAPSPTCPLTKTARHAKIIALLEQHEVRSQTELADLLAADGLHVTQGTLSRDLVEVGALRVRGAGGHLVYAVPGEGGDRTPHVGEFASFEGGSPGCAARCWSPPRRRPTWSCCAPRRAPRSTSPRPSTGSGWDSILGTIAGDDTDLADHPQPRRRRGARRHVPRHEPDRQTGAAPRDRRTPTTQQRINTYENEGRQT